MEILQSTHLYMYLKLFLEEKEYRNLMNTNQEMFREIKNESITYQLTMWNTFHGPSFSLLSTLIRFLKYPQRQLTLVTKDLLETEYVKLKDFSSSLHTLDIYAMDTIFDNTFDFTIFNNIPIVKLGAFTGVTKITSGLQNIQELELEMETLEEIYDMNVTGSLRKLTLINCSHLKRLPTQSSLRNSEISLFLLNPRFSLKTITFEDPSTLNFSRLFSHHIKELSLYVPQDIFNSGEYLLLIDYSVLATIPSLHLTGNESMNIKLPFLGKKLTLEFVNLSKWHEIKAFYELHVLRLINCHTRSCTFPEMPKLEKLDLHFVVGVEVIPSFPCLKHLKLYTFVKLREIQKQPKLKRLEMYYCSYAVDVHELDGQNFHSVCLEYCHLLSDISPFRNAYTLIVTECPRITQLSFEHSSIDASRRRVKLDSIEQPLHVFPASTFCNIHTLDLIHVEVNDEVILRNISYLRLSNCKDYCHTTNLENIMKGLVIDKCHDLLSLSNLQHIPNVVLSSLPNVKDISGLGHHDHLYITEVPLLSRLAQSYAADRVAGFQDQNPYHYIFSTIKALTIIVEKQRLNFTGDWSFTFKNCDQIRLW